MKKTSIFILFVVFGVLESACERKKPSTPEFPTSTIRKSPIAISSVKVGQSYIKIVYGQPYRDGRTIFGDWEPYGEVWRTGANEATEITITKPVLMASQQINPGTYSVFTIPGEDRWTVILNRELGLWGAFDYKPELDYIRFEVPTFDLDEEVEVLTITFAEVQQSVTSMKIEWDLVGVEIPIRFFEE